MHPNCGLQDIPQTTPGTAFEQNTINKRTIDREFTNKFNILNFVH